MPPVKIDFGRELVIRDLHVVQDQTPDANDHCRTTWNPACPANLRGRWTFGWMMAVMAGTSNVDDPMAKTFVKNWLKKWLSDQQPNSMRAPAASRTAIVETLIDPWLTASNCSSAAVGNLTDIDNCPQGLDLTKAPFRLLAFVNRIDLPATPGYSAGGEFRVVFGALGVDWSNSTGGSSATLQATVILEYNYPRTLALQTWATKMHALSGLDPTSLAPAPPFNLPSTVEYRNELQAITDGIVGPMTGIIPLGILTNNSNIAHVRTNEIAFDCQSRNPDGPLKCNGAAPDSNQAVWEARQFILGGPIGSTGQFLVQDTVSQTPPTEDNHQAPVDNQLTKYCSTKTPSTALQVDCLVGKPAYQSTDTALLGNASQSPSNPVVPPIVWESSPTSLSTVLPSLSSVDRSLARHMFGFGTCNGCHYKETANQNGFFHIGPRDDNTIASISNFLSANYAMDPLASTNNQDATVYTTVSNPLGGSTIFKYNEPWRRACEIRRILSGSTTPYTTATGHIN